jgi:homoisocitrate dehydrogenase
MKLCVIEGDGIGHEVIPVAVKVLETLFPSLEVIQAQAGWEFYQENGTPLTDETLELVRECGALLYGAATTPSYPVERYYSPIVRLRRETSTYANIRPIAYLPVPAAREGVDLIVVRENTEDVYVSDEQSSAGGDRGTAKKIITRAASERVAQMAFRLAQLAGRKKVTIVHKANVLPQTDGLFRRVAFEIAEQYPEIETDELLIDTAAYWMVKEPTRFDIVLTTNQYGDILSDMAAAWGGGRGFVPALNLGADVAIAEPVHGSAPDIAGRGIANPVAAILSAALLVRYHWHQPDIAHNIEQAVYDTLHDGRYTFDVQTNSASNTAEFGDLILEKLA